MEHFWARLGFGCARLRGGAEESNSRRLLDTAIECGFRYFDTAPAYGSEALVGRALRDLRGEVQICTKVGLTGSAASPSAKFRGVVLTGIRSVVPESFLTRMKRARARKVLSTTPAVERNYGRFSAESVRSSFRRSLELLQTDRVECLMLHEPRLSDPAPDVELALGELMRDGAVGRLGVGTGFQWEQLPAFGDVAQFAIGPRPPAEEHRSQIAHGLLRGFDAPRFEHCVRQAKMLDSAPWLEKRLAAPLVASALLLNTALIGSDYSRILISTSSVANLQNFMGAASRMFADLQPAMGATLQAKCREVLQQYLAGANHVA